jgi:predicted TIM-barrel fold metal-dependent hydrolase
MVVVSPSLAQAGGGGEQNSAYGSLRSLIPSMRRPLLIAVVTLTAAVALTAQQPQTPGQLRPRPAEGREPEFPQPTIREYKPRSTLVVPQHPVPRAKFAVIDMHGHPFAGPGPVKAEDYEKVVKAMDGINVQLMVNVSGASGERLKQMLDVIRNSPYPDRMAVFTNINFRDPVGPGFGAATARQIEDDVKNGARGLGEIMKGFGLTAKKLDGSRLHLDDPELDPIWDTCARLNIPVHIHTADPAEFFQPIDFHNERWLELALYRDRRYDDRSKFPSFEELMGERDRLFARHPKTKFIVAHMGWHANDLARIGGMLDRMPNLTTEVGAVLYDIGRQPRAAHEFFLKYQDRIMFGKDAFQPDEYPYYWRVFETNDEYFDYYRDYHAFWKLYGIGLPDNVLKKLYYQNAMKIIPGLPHGRFSS